MPPKLDEDKENDPLHICSECGCLLPLDWTDAYCEECLEELDQLEDDE